MDLLDAQRGYLDAQIGLSNAVRDKQISMVNLYKALEEAGKNNLYDRFFTVGR